MTGLLSIVQEIVSNGQIQWDEVVSNYNEGQKPERYGERDAPKSRLNRIRTSSGAVTDLVQCIQAQIEMAAGVRTGEVTTICPLFLPKTSIRYSSLWKARP